jgi:hypothetical protein
MQWEHSVFGTAESSATARKQASGVLSMNDERHDARPEMRARRP